MDDLDLLPLPGQLHRTGAGPALRGAVALAVPPEGRTPALARLRAELERAGLPAAEPGSGAVDVELGLDDEVPGGPEAYRLTVEPSGVRVHGAGPAGLFHGVHTLAQLVRAAASDKGGGEALQLPGLVIEDAPAFPHRGAMLDVSRDRVPTMETLFALVDRFAGWKLNQLQLYTEHTFAYRGHEQVWRGASPLTPDEVRALDAYCAERFIELVPNQQSCGHLHRWLVHPSYRDLAECPEGVEHPFSSEREPFSLCPTDPRALELLADLYDQLLPCFRSRQINVGLDETFDLGRGRSADACRERGVGRVYLDFLRAVAELLRDRGRRMQFWADVALEHPELVGELPADAIPLLWGYEAESPFEAQTRALSEAGLSFYVCPGTSSWQSVAGRLANASANLAAAAEHGRGRGALGYLVTDWGDRGHLQPLPASLPGWMIAADLAWNPDARAERRDPHGVAELLARHALDDPTGASGRALVRLAGAGEATGVRIANASPLSVLLTAAERPFPPKAPEGMAALTPTGLERALEEVDSALAELAGEAMRAPDRDQVRAELVWAAGILRFACLFGLQRVHAGPGRRIAAIPADARAPLAAELAPRIEEHRTLWLQRCRPGGLERSAAWLERILSQLEDPG